MKKGIVVFILFLGLTSFINAQKVEYKSLVDYIKIEKITQNATETVIHISLKPKKGSLMTFSGAYTSVSWNLINTKNHSQLFTLKTIKNIRRGSYIEKKQLKTAEIYYLEANGEKYSAEIYYDKIPPSVAKVDMIKAIQYVPENVIIKDIVINANPIAASKTTEKKQKPQTLNLDSLNSVPKEKRLDFLFTYASQQLSFEKFDLAKKALKLAYKEIDSLNNPKDYAKILLYSGNIAYYKGEQNKALAYFKQSFRINQKAGFKKETASALNNMATIYANKLDIKNALTNYNKALNLYTQLGLKKSASQVNYQIGSLYYQTQDAAKALLYYNKALVLEEKSNNISEKMSSYNNIGVLYYEKNQFGKALKNYFSSLKIARKTKQNRQEAITLNNIGNVKFDEQKYNEAIDYYNKSKDLSQKIKYLKGLAIAIHNSANAYLSLHKLDSAKLLFNRSLQIAKDINLKDVSYNSYRGLANVYAEENDCNQSLELYKKYAELRFAISEKKLKQINIMQEKYIDMAVWRENQFKKEIKRLKIENISGKNQIRELITQIKAERIISQLKVEKKNRDLQIIAKEKQIQTMELQSKSKELEIKRIQIGGLAGILLLVFALLILLSKMNTRKKKDNKLLELKNKQLEEQKTAILKQRDEIEQKNKKIEKQKEAITDSIMYAKRIQMAVLPPVKWFNEILPENFIFFRPRDIVSGDFYWINQRENKIIVVAADCTGHGVPGAFMSMLGVSYLNRLWAEIEFNNASEVLDKLRDFVIETLNPKQTEYTEKDGMDMSLVIIDYDKKELQYAGAYNSLYIVGPKDSFDNPRQINAGNNLSLFEWKADKMPIGAHLKQTNSFTNHIIPYHKGDMIYMFSDGFADQFGGKSGHKYMAKNFKNLLLKIAQKKAEEQMSELEFELQNWQADNEQVDDILILGFRLL